MTRPLMAYLLVRGPFASEPPWGILGFAKGADLAYHFP